MLWWFSTAGLGLLVLLWLTALLRFRRGEYPDAFRIESDSAPDPLPDPAPGLAIVIPARNEEARIEGSVNAALAVDWKGPLEVIVVNDRSSDETGAILEGLTHGDSRLRVVCAGPLPADWLGKPHALHLGAETSVAEWLLFVDADVTLAPAGPSRLVGRAFAQGANVASGLGHLTVDSFWEKVLQPRIEVLATLGNPLEAVNNPDDPRALASGQCILFERKAYHQLGGHAAPTVRGSLVEGVQLAKRAKREGVPYRLFFAPDVFACRMYRGFRETWKGWTRTLFPGLKYEYGKTVFVTLLLLATTVLPFVLAAKNLVALALGSSIDPLLFGLEAAACGLILLLDILRNHRYGHPTGVFWTYPIAMVLFAIMCWASALQTLLGRDVEWKGRIVEAQRDRA